ncbi:MAG: hypothetical protein DSY46_06725 [Hydrogenimonas sp.]|nr:MAG: hypothetical protein DSY46_06725 [Hydrogenimonas sp.]
MALQTRFKLFESIDLVVASIIFIALIITGADFTKTIILLLELIVIIEVTQMIFIFFKKHRIKLRYMIDTAIIYILRELMISITHEHIDMLKISTIIASLFALFFMRYLAITITYSSKMQMTD